jgi:hypothetical protein
MYPPFMWVPSLGPTNTIREVRNRIDAAVLNDDASWNRDGVLLSTAGTDGKITIPYSTRLALAGTFSQYSTELLIRVDTSMGDYTRVFTQDGFGGPWDFFRRSTNDRWDLNVAMSGSSVGGIYTTRAVTAGETYHVISVVDGLGSFATTYINGVNDGVDSAVSGTITFNTGDWEICERLDGTVLGIALWPGIALSAGAVAKRTADFYAPLRLRRLLAGTAAAPPAFGGVSQIIGGGIIAA